MHLTQVYPAEWTWNHLIHLHLNTWIFLAFNQPILLNIDRKLTEMMIYSGVSYFFWEWHGIAWTQWIRVAQHNIFFLEKLTSLHELICHLGTNKGSDHKFTMFFKILMVPSAPWIFTQNAAGLFVWKCVILSHPNNGYLIYELLQATGDMTEQEKGSFLKEIWYSRFCNFWAFSRAACTI